MVPWYALPQNDNQQAITVHSVRGKLEDTAYARWQDHSRGNVFIVVYEIQQLILTM